jgi:hypothetical protein
MYSKEAVLLANFRQSIRTSEEYPEYFEKCYTKIIETAMKGQRSFTIQISVDEIVKYQSVLPIFSALGYSTGASGDDTYCSMYISWQ